MIVKKNEPIYAALDLGSNSFHLILARFESGKLVVVDRYRDNVQFALGLRSDGMLTKKSMDDALESLKRFAERLRSTPVRHRRVVGTNTLRAAKNADSFLQRAEEILQCPINIISGTEEARLIYLGVANDLALDNQQRLVIDIGGGSTELVVGKKTPLYLESLYMGCVSYSQRYFPNGVISIEGYKKAVLATRVEVQRVAERFSANHWSDAVGSSGSIRSIEKCLEGMGLNTQNTITAAALEILAEKVLQYKHCDDIRLPNLTDERRNVFASGLAILQGIFLELNILNMTVSNYAIREGILLDLAGRIQNKDIRVETVNHMMKQYSVEKAQVDRVQRLALKFLEQVKEDFSANYEQVKRRIHWAISLHEIGLAIAHSGYQKHGAYLLLNSDMPGFSKQEQKLLGFLVLNHRRKLKPLAATYGFTPDWRKVHIIRLACLFNRRRDGSQLPDNLQIHFKDNSVSLKINKNWFESHPLTAQDLREESTYLETINITLNIQLND